MPKLRHIAMVVEEIEKTAQFYEKSFGKPVATYRVDGVEVLEYRTNLLREVLPSLGLGVGPK